MSTDETSAFVTAPAPTLLALSESDRDRLSEALQELRNVNLGWYVGLDADATKIGDMLWRGEDVDETTMARVVGLFRLTFTDPVVMTEKDAVKCAQLPLDNAFALSVKAELPESFWRYLFDRLAQASQKRLAN